MNIKQLLIATILLLSSAAYGQPDFEETKLLAEQGNANAQTILGVMYDNGEGVPENMSSDEKGELIIISELSISELRREIIAVEDEFFRVFNENNDDDSLDVHCRKERMVYSLIPPTNLPTQF
jgi:hypothetical protein